MNTNKRMRWWLSTCAVTAGIGAALLAGAGTADADTGDTDTGRSTTSERAEKSTSNSTGSAENRSEQSNRHKSADREVNSARAGGDNAGSARVRAAHHGIERPSGGLRDVAKHSAKVRMDSGRSPAMDLDPTPDLPAVASSPGAPEMDAIPMLQTPASAVQVAPQPVAAAVAATLSGNAQLQVAPGLSVETDWYFPATGTPAGLIYLQHGNLRENGNLRALATALSQQTNSVVVAPSFQSSSALYPKHYLNGQVTQEGVAKLFDGNRTALHASAAAVGFTGVLPKSYVLSGHSYGGQMVTVVADYRVPDTGIPDPNLKGVLLLDAVNQNGQMAASLKNIPIAVPVYQIAAEPGSFNNRDAGTKLLKQARPTGFIGVRIVGGAHLDAEGSSTTFLAAVAAGFPKASNAAALQVLASGYVTDMYKGLGEFSPGRSGVYPVAGLQVPVGQAKVVRL